MNNFEMMKRRLEFQGGIRQEDRMIHGKYLTFLQALEFSYQSADIQLVQHYNDCLPAIAGAQPAEPIIRALINPDKTKQDYDDKLISIDYKNNIGVGDVFKWIGTDSYWIIYLRQLTEDAYFRGEIRRCRHKINFKDKDGNWRSTWAYIRGPIETQIENIQKNQIRIDRPNLGLNIIMPRNKKTIQAFDRYSQFLFAGRGWQVQAPDSISTEHILEFAAEEYYIDKDKDDIENQMKDGLVIEPVDPNEDNDIIGETWIRPLISFTYEISNGAVDGAWTIKEDKVPVELCKQGNGSKVKIKWTAKGTGQFTLLWSKDNIVAEKVIIVESLL